MKNPPPNIVQRIGLEKLASLPQATLRLLQACNDPEVGFTELAEIIGRDTSLTSKVLDVSNSAVYAQWNQVSDLKRLMVVLGLGTLKAIAVTSSVAELFSRLRHGRERHLGRIWYRSLLCAELARDLAAASDLAHPEEAYLAGLLHRIGQWVLVNSDPQGYARLIEAHQDPSGLRQAEQAQFGIDHAELAAWLASHWHLGDLFSDALRYQWEAARSMLDAPGLVRLMNLCARLSEPYHRVPALDDGAILLSLERTALEEGLATADAKAREAAETFGIGIEIEAAECGMEAEVDIAPFPPERARLAALVQDSALIETVRAAMYDQTEALEPLATIQTFLSILFSLDGSVFLLEQGDRHLRGSPVGDEDRWVAQFHVTLAPGRSLLCDALLQDRPLDSFAYADIKGTLNVVDRQLIHRLGSSGILAIPLILGKERLGVILSGVEPAGIEALAPYRALLVRFAREATRLILRRRADRERERIQAVEGRAQALERLRAIRHEAANPLGIASNYLHVLGHKLSKEDPARTELDIVKQEIARVGDILATLSPTDEERTASDGLLKIDTLVHGLLEVLGPTLFEPRGITVEVEVPPDIPPLAVAGTRLKQVLVNLLKNAAEAMPRGGRIRIEGHDHLISAEGDFVELIIADTGPGLPMAIRKQLFRPLVSSKGGRHAGLGLSISFDLMRKMGGSLECRTGAQGTEFHILIPRQTSDRNLAH